MVMEEFETGINRKWPLGKDIVEEIKNVAEMPPVELVDWDPLFEPYAFNNSNQPLQIIDYQLSNA